MSDEHLSPQQLNEMLACAENLIGPYPAAWQHNKYGAIYMTMGLAFEEATMDIVVVYQQASRPRPDLRNIVFTRPLADFLEKFTKYRF